jgi:hypothetical protein
MGFQVLRSGEDRPLVCELEELIGRRKIAGCPRHCHGGHHGMDNCNTCHCTGSGFYIRDKFYPNSEEGWSAALKDVRAAMQCGT